MKRISHSALRHQLSQVLNEVAYSGERVLIHHRGKDVAAIISIDDLELLRRLEASSMVSAPGSPYFIAK